jgi:Asp/Glu/hydantoin racemase
MERETVERAGKLIEEARHEQRTIGAIVLECTQMPPYAEAIQRKTGVPVYDVYTMGEWFYNGLVRRTSDRWREDIGTDGN